VVCVTAVKQIPCESLSQNEANCRTATSFVSCQNCTHAAVSSLNGILKIDGRRVIYLFCRSASVVKYTRTMLALTSTPAHRSVPAGQMAMNVQLK
jgi:hypothetical protein